MTEQLPLAVGLDDHARFSTFYPGPNGLAARQLQALEEERTPVAWIWGPTGSGKSHLLQAACADAAEHGRESAYIPLTDAGAEDPVILENYDRLDLVCLDDLGTVAGNANWESAIFSLFNKLVENGGTLLVAADSSPQAAGIQLEDLRSRLTWGPTFRLQMLSEGESIEALRLRAHERGFEFPDEVGEWLLRRAPRDMVSLYNLLDTLDTESLAAGRRLTIPFVREIFAKQEPSA